MSRIRLSAALAVAAIVGSMACNTDKLTSPDQNFSVELGCLTLDVPRGDFTSCPLTITAKSGVTATIESVVLLANGKDMTDFTHSPGLSFYTDPIPANLQGQTVDATGLSVDVRAYADVDVTPGAHPAGIRVTYRLAGASSSTTVTVPFDIVVT